MKIKKVYKYGTGEIIPNDAIYLYSREERGEPYTLVWHYFLVVESANTEGGG